MATDDDDDNCDYDDCDDDEVDDDACPDKGTRMIVARTTKNSAFGGIFTKLVHTTPIWLTCAARGSWMRGCQLRFQSG